MNHALSSLPAAYRLYRKDVCHFLNWSRTTLWRRERDGLRFVEGTIELGALLAWLEKNEWRPIDALTGNLYGD
jgi:hypothetical protein